MKKRRPMGTNGGFSSNPSLEEIYTHCYIKRDNVIQQNLPLQVNVYFWFCIHGNILGKYSLYRGCSINNHSLVFDKMWLCLFIYELCRYYQASWNLFDILFFRDFKDSWKCNQCRNRVTSKMRVAVVGAGISGLVSAYVLAKAGVEVVLYEKEDYLGGHAKTVSFDGVDLDLGFMVFNRVSHILLSIFLSSLTPSLPPSLSLSDPSSPCC